MKKITKLGMMWETYIFHCTECHHEWEGADKKPKKCDWCGAPGKLLKWGGKNNV
jgi:rubrerythrin